MKPFEKILVPVDFGLHSAEAMRRAVDVAGHYGASLTLIYVYEPLDYALPEGYALYTPEHVGQLLDEFRERLRAAAGEVQAMGAQSVAHEVLSGPAASEIVEFARARGMDLIVMGTHGRRGLSHLLMGSVAERVLRTAPCPVLTVKVEEAAGRDAGDHAKGKAA
jgi:nucleotide-binding universal stress UspA family protein